MQSSKHDILILYRQLLKASLKFSSYNFKQYFNRKVKHDFRTNQLLVNDQTIKTFIKEQQLNLKVLKRQAFINSEFQIEPLVIEDKV